MEQENVQDNQQPAGTTTVQEATPARTTTTTQDSNAYRPAAAYPVTEQTRSTTVQEPAVYKTTTQSDDPVWSATGVRIVVFLLGIVESVLLLRLLLKLLAANAGSTFVTFIYGVSGFLLGPFKGIFGSTSGGSGSVLEPATLVAMLVYALLAWGLVKLIMIFRRKRRS